VGFAGVGAGRPCPEVCIGAGGGGVVVINGEDDARGVGRALIAHRARWVRRARD
jgi:hypothetical protein